MILRRLSAGNYFRDTLYAIGRVTCLSEVRRRGDFTGRFNGANLHVIIRRGAHCPRKNVRNHPRDNGEPSVFQTCFFFQHTMRHRAREKSAARCLINAMRGGERGPGKGDRCVVTLAHLALVRRVNERPGSVISPPIRLTMCDTSCAASRT